MANIIDIEVFNKLFSSVAEEMGIVLGKAAFSPNIKERHDFSCAIFDGSGELVAQAAHIPVHLGSLPMTLESAMNMIDFEPGDVVIVNSPYLGGSHLPDITLIEPLFDKGEIKFFLVNRAHHADVGGTMPGSMGMTTNIQEEGVLIEPSYLYKNGKLENGFFQSFLAQILNPEERRGDIQAQVASLGRGKKRLKEMIDKYSFEFLSGIIEELKNYSERIMRSILARIPDGCYCFSDFLDDYGVDTAPLEISCMITITGESAVVDFSKSADQVPSPVNTVFSVVNSAVMYVFLSVLNGEYPVNHGSCRPIKVLVRTGSLLNSTSPYPVAAGNVETSQRIVDVLFGALSKALPEQIPAASCGSMNNVTIGREKEYAYYETIGGGMGAGALRNGLSGIHTHMTNTMNTPIEALEHAYPFMISRYSLRKKSGGKGKFNGGNGIIREYQFDSPAHVSLLTERRVYSPYGIAGGKPGKKGKNELIRAGKTKKLAAKISFEVLAGDTMVIKTPGGGGWGVVS
jgi:N-methylhydantoinase B